MLRSYLTAWACLFGFALAPSAAHAGQVFSADELLFQPGGVTLKLVNYEGLGVDLGTPGVLNVGDTLRGVFRISSGEPTTGGDILSLTGFELTGIFETEVLSVTPNAVGTALGNSFSDFTFGPNAAFEAVYGAGAMIVFFEDFNPNFGEVFQAGQTIAGAEAVATDGNLYATFGAGAAHADEFGAGDYFWAASGFADLSEVGAFPLTTEFTASLKLLTQPGTNLQFVADQNQTPVAAFQGLGWENIFNELALQGNVTLDQSNSPYPLQSNDPARLHAVPEASSVIAWAGFVVVGGLTYRRRRATAAKA